MDLMSREGLYILIFTLHIKPLKSPTPVITKGSHSTRLYLSNS